MVSGVRVGEGRCEMSAGPVPGCVASRGPVCNEGID